VTQKNFDRGPLLVDPEPSPPISEVHIWIGVYADGSNGILSADLGSFSDGVMRHGPLMHSCREVAVRAQPIVDHIRRATLSLPAARHIVSVKLECFRVQPATRLVCGYCAQHVDDEWTYCPYCGSQDRRGAEESGQ
jgi:hypothetical protein